MNQSNATESSPKPSSNDNASIAASQTGQSATSIVEYDDDATSTVVHDQEPFDSFSLQAAQLCEDLFPQKAEGLKARLLDRARSILRIGGLNTRQSHKAVIERMRGGDYNRITGIRIPASKSEPEQRLILRTARELIDDQSSPKREVALLHYLHYRTAIPVPAVIRWDLARENALEAPYVFLQRLSGQDLSSTWDTMNFGQRKSVAAELGKSVNSLLNLQCAEIGIMDSQPTDYETPSGQDIKLSIRPLKIETCAGGTIGEGPDTFEPSSPVQDTLEFFELYLEFWRDRAVKIKYLKDAELCSGVLKVVREMNDLGVFNTGNCLCHVDFHQRNIIAEVVAPESIKFTGILDWDEALFAPKFLPCEPPWWLWRSDDNPGHVDDEDLGTWPYETSGPSETARTTEQDAIKKVFEQYAGSEYTRLAYDAEYRFARCLFRICQGLADTQMTRAIKRVFKEWEALKASLSRKRPTEEVGLNLKK